MLMTCTDAIPSIQPSWLPGMSNFPSFLPTMGNAEEKCICFMIMSVETKKNEPGELEKIGWPTEVLIANEAA